MPICYRDLYALHSYIMCSKLNITLATCTYSYASTIMQVFQQHAELGNEYVCTYL